MTFALVLAGALAFGILLRKPIGQQSVLFYGLAIAIDVIFLVGLFFGMPKGIWMVFTTTIQKCTASLALFVIVMYIGVMPASWRLHRWLDPIRGNLSIIAWFLALGHMGVYLSVYVPNMLEHAQIRANLAFSFCIAIVLFALLMVLGITSFLCVKKRMSAGGWKRVQKLAYPFFLLVYVHLMVILLPAALAGASKAQASVAVYSIIFFVYAALRLIRYGADRKAQRLAERTSKERA